MYTIGGVSKTETQNQQIHSIPCKIGYTGPATVESNFIRSKVEGETTERGMFRGRGLEGADWKPPNNYQIVVVKERKGPKGTMLDIEAKADSIKVWEWDKSCGENANRTTIGRASTYLKIANALAN
ncbi:unnamed protein product [Caenorhabditis angaria]|uniref:Uncharacterized protein n=1 Tax=Caenorhabditis angaria TaxID=860376 RepID=A0A9P1ICS3_9PELO|nr:unnamed protein product [Caenorhabditis angaria]